MANRRTSSEDQSIQCRSPWTKARRSRTITRESSFHVENLLSTPMYRYARKPTLPDCILQSKPYSPNPVCLLLGLVSNKLSLSHPRYHWTRRRSYRSITTSYHDKFRNAAACSLSRIFACPFGPRWSLHWILALLIQELLPSLFAIVRFGSSFLPKKDGVSYLFQ